MFNKHDIRRDACQLFGEQAHCGYDWWWHSFTAHHTGTGRERAFFIEFFLCNPAVYTAAKFLPQRQRASFIDVCATTNGPMLGLFPHVNPGEMLCASLGACMMTMVGFMAAKHGDKAEGTAIEVHPHFDDKHSRITGFELVFHFPAHFTPEQKEKYAKLAQGCPVHNSLREDMQYTVTVK